MDGEHQIADRKKRRSIAISKAMGWGGGGLAIFGAFHAMSPLFDRFTTKEEGQAIIRDTTRIERKIDDNVTRLERINKENRDELNAAIEKQGDRILRAIDGSEHRTLMWMKDLKAETDALKLRLGTLESSSNNRPNRAKN